MPFKSHEIAGNFSLVGLGWNLGASLFGPLFQFNKNKRRMEVEKFKAEEVAFKYEKTVLNACIELPEHVFNIFQTASNSHCFWNHTGGGIVENTQYRADFMTFYSPTKMVPTTRIKN